MKSQYRAVNRYISKIKATSGIDWTSVSGTFQIDDISVGWFSLPQWNFIYFVTADFAQTGKEEIFRIVNTTGDVLTYDKRISVWWYVKPSHSWGASLRINDAADILNEMSDNIDNFGDINLIEGTQTIKVWGWVFNNSGIVYQIANQVFIVTSGQLVDNSTNYVHFDLTTRLFVISASSTYWAWICMASVVVAAWAIWTIVDLRPWFASSYWPFPSQTGNSWKVLSTDGTNATWSNILNLYVIKWSIQTDTDAATITFNKNVNDFHSVVLGWNRTLALSNMAVWDRIVINLVQDWTGSRTVTWFTTIKWQWGIVPVLTPTAWKGDLFAFWCTAAGTYYGMIIWQNF